ncbi:hypothetical protein B0H14DRAFT_2611512 [Mycena olivaceomarginata]|nr:hypothetical protein B0H14DRAFT_2611512 [Mycena olivaceomarginata]
MRVATRAAGGQAPREGSISPTNEMQARWRFEPGEAAGALWRVRVDAAVSGAWGSSVDAEGDGCGDAKRGWAVERAVERAEAEGMQAVGGGAGVTCTGTQRGDVEAGKDRRRGVGPEQTERCRCSRGRGRRRCASRIGWAGWDMERGRACQDRQLAFRAQFVSLALPPSCFAPTHVNVGIYGRLRQRITSAITTRDKWLERHGFMRHQELYALQLVIRTCDRGGCMDENELDLETVD